MKPKVGRNLTSERGEGVKGEVKNISLHWLQGIFETVPKLCHQGCVLGDRGTIKYYNPRYYWWIANCGCVSE